MDILNISKAIYILSFRSRDSGKEINGLMIDKFRMGDDGYLVVDTSEFGYEKILCDLK